MGSDATGGGHVGALGGAQRLYVYVVLLVTGLITGFGLSALGAAAVRAAWPVPDSDPDLSRDVAVGLALVVVAGPVWLVHWRMAARETTRVPAARRWALRQVYLNATLLTALVVSAFTASIVLSDLFSANIAEMDRVGIAAAPVWAAIWALHWRAARATWEPGHVGRSLHRWYLHFATAAGLSLLAVGTAAILSAVLRTGYESAFRDQFTTGVGIWERSSAGWAATAVIAGALWAGHWWAGAKHDHGSTLRTVYVTVAAVVPMAVVAAATIRLLAGLIRLALGAGAEPVSTSLDALPWAAGTGVVFGLVWLHHVRLLPARGSSVPGVPVWVHRYAMRGVGLSAFSATAIIGISVVIAASVPEARGVATGGDWWRGLTSSALAALLAGVGVWLLLDRTDPLPASDGADDMPRLRVRRLYLFVCTALSLLAAVGAAATLLTIVLNDALDARFGAATLADSRWAIAVMATSAVVSFVHRRRAGLDMGAAMADLRPGRARRFVFVAPQGADEMKIALEQAIGRPLEWRQDLAAAETAPSLDPEVVASAARAAADAPGREVLIIVGGQRIQVASYD